MCVTGTVITSDLNTLPSDYVSVNPEGMKGPRQEDGSLPNIDFMKILPDNSKLIDAGSEVAPFDGESRYSVGITYNGAAPDLGYLETGDELGVQQITISSNTASLLHAVATHNGYVVITVDGASATDSYNVVMADITGRVIGSGQFMGHTFTLMPMALPDSIILIRVIGEGFDSSLKIRL